MYAQVAIKPNTLLRNGAYGIVMKGVQKCTRGCSSLRGRKRLPLCCIKLDTATDPTSGSGSLLINIGKSVSKYMADANNVKYYAQELKENTYNLTRMNLVMRGIKTLAVRMERQQENAGNIARWLTEQKKVRKVYYAGLETHPGYEINAKQARGAGAMISFDVDSVETAQRVLEKVRVITFAESLGGTESLITYPMKQTHPDVPKEWREKLGITDTLLRLSVGLEHVDELIADLEQAFVS